LLFLKYKIIMKDSPTTNLASLWEDDDLSEDPIPSNAPNTDPRRTKLSDSSQLRYDPSTLDPRLLRRKSSSKGSSQNKFAGQNPGSTPLPHQQNTSRQTEFSRNSSPTSVRSGLRQSFSSSLTPSYDNKPEEYPTLEIPGKELENTISESEVDAFFAEFPPSPAQSGISPGKLVSASSILFQNVFDNSRPQTEDEIPDITNLVEPLRTPAKPVIFPPSFFEVDNNTASDDPISDLEFSEEPLESVNSDEFIDID
jgi:hypothetical protein